MKKDILFLCQFFYPEYISSAKLPFDLANALVEAIAIMVKKTIPLPIPSLILDILPRSSTLKKAFGSKIYDMRMSDNGCRIINLDWSI